MLLTGSVAFKRPLEACNKVQIPKIIQGQFKLEPDQVSAYCSRWVWGSHEFFYGRIGKDGRLSIPKVVLFMACGKIENPAGTCRHYN